MISEEEYLATYNPLPWQCDVLTDDTQYKVLMIGRQGGKTTLLRQLIYSVMLGKPNQRVIFAAYTSTRARQLMWDPLLKVPVHHQLFPPQLVASADNSTGTLTLINGSTLRVTGTSDSAEGDVRSILGSTIDLIIFDEFQSHRYQHNIWSYTQPVLAARNGKAVFAGTARRNEMWDFYEMGLGDNPYFKSWKLTTAESGSPAGTPHAIAMAKASMSEEFFKQEYECEPAIHDGFVYPAFGKHNIKEYTGDRQNICYHIGVDFNVDNMCAIVGVKNGNNFYIIDEISLRYHNANTHGMVNEIKRRYGKVRKIIYPDSSGRNRDVSAVDPDNTNHQILRKAGFNLNFPNSGNENIVDRVILVNTKLRTANGDVSLFVSPKCKEVQDALRKRMYDNGKPDKKSGYDHHMDAMEYTLTRIFANKNGFIQNNMYKQPTGNFVADSISGNI